MGKGVIVAVKKRFSGIWIQSWLLNRPEISPGAKLVYVILLDHSRGNGDGESGECFVDVLRIAKELGLSVSQKVGRADDSPVTRKYIKELVDCGLIGKENGRYYFLWHEWMGTYEEIV